MANFGDKSAAQCNVLGEYGIGHAGTAEPIELVFGVVTGESSGLPRVTSYSNGIVGENKALES